MWFHFLSHKFGRLVLPYAILSVIVGTLLLPASPVRWALLGAEALFFLLALIDRFFPKGFALKRLSSPARTFLAMNAASMLGIVVFFIRPNRLWRPTQVKAR
jgi:hypothetical protein